MRHVIKIGSVWTFERWRDGRLIDKLRRHNIIPDALIDHILDVCFSGGSQKTAWYIAPFSDDYTPDGDETYAVPGFTEFVAYDESARPTWSDGGVSGQAVSNAASKAEFTCTGVATTIYGAALFSVATKADTATSGAVLGPVVRLSTPLTGIIDDDIISIGCTITGVDAT